MRHSKLSTVVIRTACALALALTPLRATLSEGTADVIPDSVGDGLLELDQQLNLGAPVLNTHLATVIPNRYIVVLNTSGPVGGILSTVIDLAKAVGGAIHFEYTAALVGFAATLPPLAVEVLRHNPLVAFIEADQTVTINTIQPDPPSWGLDRVDQPHLPLDDNYIYHTDSTGVTAYILDTGIRITHQDFGGRAVSGFDAIDGGSADDCHGHGTHVAGTVGGSTYGVAKNVQLVAVRVLDCGGSGSFSEVIAGIDWVTNDHQPGEPAVANMSLGASGSDPALEMAVQNSIADGVTYAIAAGNSSADACHFTPARTPEAITVGATTITDARASFSNYGTCLDLFAPGVNITSAWNNNDTARNTISGTSMAAPHVAGVAALYLDFNPAATPQQVRNVLVGAATPDVVGNPGSGSPNLLLYSPLNTDADEDGVAVGEGDCDDTNPNIHPGATELCNEVDDNCDGGTDEGFDLDQSCSVGIGACQQNGEIICTPEGTGSHCSATPGTPSPEVCNGVDDDCDGFVDDSASGVGQSCATDQPGVCSAGTTVCTDGALSCMQTTPSSNEVCDGLDNDCDGQVDDGLTIDTDGDGFSTPASCGGSKNDCNDTTAAIHPGAPEVCDGGDNDCDGQVDEGVDNCCLGHPATIVGTNGLDVIFGTPGADVIMGQGGIDTINGLGGNDVICGGDGADVLTGGPGTDSINGGAGLDTCLGAETKQNCELL